MTMSLKTLKCWAELANDNVPIIYDKADINSTFKIIMYHHYRNYNVIEVDDASEVDASGDYELYGTYNSIPLLWAIEHSEALAIQLITIGVDINVIVDGFSALHRAVIHEQLNVVQLLLSRGASPSLRSEKDPSLTKQPSLYHGLTPLHMAVDKELIRITNALLHAGANVGALALNGDIGVISSLALAQKKGNRNIINLLEMPSEIRLGNQIIAFGQAMYQRGFLGHSFNAEIFSNCFLNHFPAAPGLDRLKVKRVSERIFNKIIDVYSCKQSRSWHGLLIRHLEEWRFWNNLHIQHLIEHRHSHPSLQHEYDKRFALRVYHPIKD